jgi:hypothetical protein
MKNSLAIVSFLLLAGCSAKVVGIYNPGSLEATPKTFYVYFPEAEDSFSPERQKLDQQLVEIISQSLTGKGLTKSSIPDLYVSFIISVHTTEEFNQNNMNPYDFRYRYYNYGFYDPTLFNSQSYKEGVLIIDIKNGENILVWQGSKSFKLNARKSSSDELLDSCLEIMAAFDPQLTN